MSFIPLDRVDFSRDESANLQDTPVRLRAMSRCKSPVPPSETSATPDAPRVAPGARVQPTPAQQTSIPRHKRPNTDVLRVINESMTELYDELHNRSASGNEIQGERLADICRKLDVIASVVLRHDRQLAEQSQLLRDSSSRPRSARRDESAELIDSIMQRVNDVDELTTQLRSNASSKQRRGAVAESTKMVSEVAGPLYRIAEALDSVTKEVQRQHSTIDRLVSAQRRRDEDRAASELEARPPSAIGSESQIDAYQSAARFRARMDEAAIEADAYDDSVIVPDEASPRRARAQSCEEAEEYDYRIEVEGDIDPSPRRARGDADPSPRRARGEDFLAIPTPSNHATTVASKALPRTPLMRTTTKQPEYLLRSATKYSSHRKPIARADIFESSSESSAQSPMRLDDTRSDLGRTSASADPLVRQLLAENESLKDQLYRQLVKNDDLRYVAESTPRGRSRNFGSSTTF